MKSYPETTVVNPVHPNDIEKAPYLTFAGEQGYRFISFAYALELFGSPAGRSSFRS